MEYIDRHNQRNTENDYICDFGDHIPVVYEPFESAAIPVFAKNRPLSSNSPIILWTHTGYRRAREEGIAGNFRVSWEEKIPELIWRGTPRGSLLLSDGMYIGAWDLYRRTRNGSGKSDFSLSEYSEFKELCEDKFQRFKLISQFQDRLNVRFVDFQDDLYPDVSEYMKKYYKFGDWISRREVAQYKYLLVLGGHDAGTQVNWALSSNSVLLMPPRDFHSTTSLGLQEWSNYVPVRSDLADLEERVDWCKNNDETCRAIAENAMAYVANFRPQIEAYINKRIVKRYKSGPSRLRGWEMLQYIRKYR